MAYSPAVQRIADYLTELEAKHYRGSVGLHFGGAWKIKLMVMHPHDIHGGRGRETVIRLDAEERHGELAAPCSECGPPPSDDDLLGASAEAPGPTCAGCGALMVPEGQTYRCTNCGERSGRSAA